MTLRFCGKEWYNAFCIEKNKRESGPHERMKQPPLPYLTGGIHENRQSQRI